MSAIPKLSPRLEAILARLPGSLEQRFEHVWDCCCDHGFLGMHIIEQQRAGHLYFVDQLPHITEPLAADLKRFGFSGYTVVTADCGQLDLSAPGSHLVIIAGVGGRALVDMLSTLQARNAGRALRFLLCATNCVYDLREFLAEHPFELLSEQIVADRGRYYEVIDVELPARLRREIDGGGRSVSRIGAMWQDHPEHRRYQQSLLAHYRRQQRGRDSERLRSIISAYEGCLHA